MSAETVGSRTLLERPRAMRVVREVALEEVPEGWVHEFELEGRKVALCREGGAVHAVASRCSYHPIPLEGSRVAGGVLTCRWYGASFDVRTGAALGLRRVEPLAVYPVLVCGGLVHVALAGGEAAGAVV